MKVEGQESPKPPPALASPFSVAHIWTTPNAIKKRKSGVEKGRGWEFFGVEMCSSGCNLSLSRLRRSRVIPQRSPVRRTEAALCLGPTQAHVHLKPLPQSAPPPLLPNPSCCRASHRHCIFFQRILCSTLDSEGIRTWNLPSQAFVWCCSCNKTLSH